MRFAIGHNVLLRRNNQYGASNSNPAIGSRWECVGRIVRIEDDEYMVRWSNGATNSGYEDSDLILESTYKSGVKEAPASLLNWPGDHKATVTLPRKRDIADTGEKRLASKDLKAELDKAKRQRALKKRKLSNIRKRKLVIAKRKST